jgi:hypothetical protein
MVKKPQVELDTPISFIAIIAIQLGASNLSFTKRWWWAAAKEEGGV